MVATLTKRVYAGKWPKVRLAILERDGWLCMIRGKGCTTQATCVDHIIPVTQGGDWYEESNLRASCKTCNEHRAGARGSRRWESVTTYITLVVGPADADLLTYVRTHSQPSDLIVDHTALTHSLGSHAAATTARNTMLNELRAGKVRTARAWITSSNPNAQSTLPHHRMVTLPPGVSHQMGGTIAQKEGARSGMEGAIPNTVGQPGGTIPQQVGPSPTTPPSITGEALALSQASRAW